MAERYVSAATIATSNLDLTEWDQAFPANKLWPARRWTECGTTRTAWSWTATATARPGNRPL